MNIAILLLFFTVSVTNFFLYFFAYSAWNEHDDLGEKNLFVHFDF